MVFWRNAKARAGPAVDDAAAPDTRAALARLRVALILFALASLVGGPWDFWWHTQVPFESFFSPPHLFIYGLTLAAIAVVTSIALSAPLRSAFGSPIRIPPLPFAAPGPLMFLGGGLLVVVLAGVLDEIWHASLGVDETRWSTPHAMFGWGLFVATVAFGSARKALANAHPVGAPESIFMGVLLCAFSMYAFLLPFAVYPTPNTIAAVSSLPTLRSQPGALHTFRIYAAWGVDRTHPLFGALAGAWMGVLLVLLRSFDGRRVVLLAVTGLSSALATALWWALAVQLGTAADPRAWLPLPLFVAALVTLGFDDGGSFPWLGWAVAGLLTGALVGLVYSTSSAGVLLALLAAPTMVTGALAGRGLARVALRPTPAAVLQAVLIGGIIVPVLWGVLDLYLRLATP